MDLMNIDNLPMLLDIKTSHHLYLDIDLNYFDTSLNRRVRVFGGKKYRVLYLNNKHELVRVVGIVTGIAPIYNPDEWAITEFVIRIDCSTENASNIVRIRTSSIRAIREYVEHMDEDMTITEGKTEGGNTTANRVLDVVIVNPKIANDGITIIGGDIINGKLEEGVTTDGVTEGPNPNGNTIVVIDNVVDGGEIKGGKVIQATMIEDTSKEYDSEGNIVKITAIIINLIARNTVIINGASVEGTIIQPDRTNVTVYGGTISGVTMITHGGISQGDITMHGTTEHGIINGGYGVTDYNGRVLYIYDIKTATGGIANNCVIQGGLISGGTGIGNTYIGTTVIGGSGTNGMSVGNTVTGGYFSFEKKYDSTKFSDSSRITDETGRSKPWVSKGDEDSTHDRGDGTRDPRDYSDDNLFRVGVGDVTGVITNFHGKDTIFNKANELRNRI